MSWDCLSAEVAVMFSDYSEREHDKQLSLEWWAAERLAVRQESNRVYRAVNKTRIRAIKRRYRQDNIEIVRAYHREYARRWRAKNAEKARAAQREQKRRWKTKNREHFREYMRQWRAANREHENARQRAARAAKKAKSA